MAFAVAVTDDGVRVWERAGDGVTVHEDRRYTPSLYVAGTDERLETLRGRLAADPKVADTDWAERFTSLRADSRERLLRVAVERPTEVRTLAREVRNSHESGPPGTLRLFNVDLEPTARYCLSTGTDPVPGATLRTLSLSLPPRALAEGDLSALRCAGERLGATDSAVLDALTDRLAARKPDVLVLSSADLVPLVCDRAADLGVPFSLGREPGYRRLAGSSTYHSYGRVGHSPARYAVPGRAIVDRSNSFLYEEAGVDGLVDLVERSRLPLQALARSSIGSVFTAIQIREALARDVVVPWRAWEPEAFKPARTLHDADRGGFIFEPDVGLHEDVV